MCKRHQVSWCLLLLNEAVKFHVEFYSYFLVWAADLSKRVSFRTDYKYAVWNDYVIIYKAGEEYVEIYWVVNRYQDITRIFD